MSTAQVPEVIIRCALSVLIGGLIRRGGVRVRAEGPAGRPPSARVSRSEEGDGTAGNMRFSPFPECGCRYTDPNENARASHSAASPLDARRSSRACRSWSEVAPFRFGWRRATASISERRLRLFHQDTTNARHNKAQSPQTAGESQLAISGDPVVRRDVACDSRRLVR